MWFHLLRHKQTICRLTHYPITIARVTPWPEHPKGTRHKELRNSSLKLRPGVRLTSSLELLLVFFYRLTGDSRLSPKLWLSQVLVKIACLILASNILVNGVGDTTLDLAHKVKWWSARQKIEAKKTYLAGICFQVKETYLAENKSLPSYIIDLEEGKIHSDV